MSLSDELLSLLLLYGLPVLFAAVLLAASGAPLPTTFLLITAGSFVEQGEFILWQVLTLALAAAVLGDQIGYGIGRWGGRRFRTGFVRWTGSADRLERAEERLNRWGAPAIFLSRWLFTPLGPPVNLTSGFAHYPWPAFLVYVAAGQAVWVALYVLLGLMFSDRVQALGDLFGDFVWLLVGLAAAVILGWKLFEHHRISRRKPSDST